MSCQICEEYFQLIKELKEEQSLINNALQKKSEALVKAELVLDQNGLSNRVLDISDTEAICVQQIQLLKEKSTLQPLTESEVKILDVLHKNLRMVRDSASNKENKKAKGLSDAELLTIVKGA